MHSKKCFFSKYLTDIVFDLTSPKKGREVEKKSGHLYLPQQ